MPLLTILSALVLLAYPLAVYFGLQYLSLPAISAVLAGMFLLRLITSKKAPVAELKIIAWLTASIGILLALLGSLFKQHNWLVFYPVVVNLIMVAFFATSLKQKQTIIERLARLQDPNLPDRAVKYTRKVTQIWCVFFILNGSTALITCFLSLKVWTLYNGLISYVLIGTLLAGEWLVRKRVKA